MQMKELLEGIEQEIKRDELVKAQEIIKERLLEIQAIRRTLDKLEKQLQNLLEKTPEELLHG